jgi:hypothetical protein
MLIPAKYVSALTFPGVIVHEAAHMLFCRLNKVAVLDVCYFRFGNPSGYVVHETPRNFWTTFSISVGPLFVNSLLCILFCFPAFVPVRIFDHGDVVTYFFLWLGLSIGMHAFPSTGDAHVLWRQAGIEVDKHNWPVIFAFPLVALIFVANFGNFFWLDLFYGVGIGLGLPELLLKKVV